MLIEVSVIASDPCNNSSRHHYCYIDKANIEVARSYFLDDLAFFSFHFREIELKTLSTTIPVSKAIKTLKLY
ncbi:hypothetical protein LDC_0884 [sediment metagenome]|uniref:Uncharacterized protein n=1 Tax=sediment metagenome TaxID=749907 RepID=D9PH84_9ZZZZ